MASGLMAFNLHAFIVMPPQKAFESKNNLLNPSIQTICGQEMRNPGESILKRIQDHVTRGKEPGLSCLVLLDATFDP